MSVWGDLGQLRPCLLDGAAQVTERQQPYSSGTILYLVVREVACIEVCDKGLRALKAKTQVIRTYRFSIFKVQ